VLAPDRDSGSVRHSGEQCITQGQAPGDRNREQAHSRSVAEEKDQRCGPSPHPDAGQIRHPALLDHSAPYPQLDFIADQSNVGETARTDHERGAESNPDGHGNDHGDVRGQCAVYLAEADFDYEEDQTKRARDEGNPEDILSRYAESDHGASS
jgi:hypothetical protein